MNKVLIVEDSQSLSALLKRKIESFLGYEVVQAYTLKETLACIEKDEFFVALIDLTLPDAPNGEAVDPIVGKMIPSIILTGRYDENIREEMQNKPIVDYVLKNTIEDIDYAIKMINRIHLNRSVQVLVVEDSVVYRKNIVSLLEMRQLTVHEANNGQEGLEKLAEHPDISLVLTDYNMPVMDGIEFTKQVRKRWSKDKLSVIAISSQDDSDTASMFLKHGANDYLIKPFTKELFYNRIDNNLEMIEMISKIKALANKDYLTGLFNRRYFHKKANALMDDSRQKKIDFCTAMIDIDHFKHVNDTYGHAAGDEVLKIVTSKMKRTVNKLGLLARYGGEEFCLLFNVDAETSEKILEIIRTQIEATKITISASEAISVTVSIGLNANMVGTLDQLTDAADTLLYEAKESGRNKIVHNIPA
jgi:diguanylate cyclase (GGDEF)-like protein